MSDSTFTELVFNVYDIVQADRYFTVQMIESRYNCSRATVQRAIRFLRENRGLNICYDKTLRVYRAGTYTPISYREAYKRRMLKNGESERQKKKLYNIYGKDWKKHYSEAKQNDSN